MGMMKKSGLCLLAVSLTVNVLFMYFAGQTMIDSDMANEMLLARHLNETGRIVSADWLYTTEVRFFNIQWIFRVFLLLGMSMHMARTFSMAVVYALYAASAIYMLEKHGYGDERYAIAGLLLWPIGSMYWFLGIFGGCYVLYGAMAMFSLGLFKEENVRMHGLNCALAFLTGLNGIKQMMVFYMPLLVGCVLWQLKRKDMKILKRAILLVIMNLAGIILNKILFVNISYQSYGATKWNGTLWDASLDIVGMFKTWGDFLALFGYQGGVKLFSFAGMASVVGCAIGLWCAYVIYMGIKDETMIWYFIVGALLVDGLAFANLDVQYNSSYWLVLYPFALAYALSFVRKHSFLPFVVAIMFAFCSTATLKREIETPLRAKKGLYETAQWLVENGHAQGYATFWNADSAVEMTSGKLEIWSLNDYSTPFSFSWAQAASHKTMAPQGEVFLIVDRSERYLPGYSNVQGRKTVFANQSYEILLFPSIEGMIATMSGK